MLSIWWSPKFCRLVECKRSRIYEPCSVRRMLSSCANDKFLDSSRLKEFADDNFEFDENGSKFSKRVEDTVGKGELLITNNLSFSYSVFKRL